MKDTNASHETILKITQALEGIAFQTDILVLNAAVSAASAGKQQPGTEPPAGGKLHAIAERLRNLAAQAIPAAAPTLRAPVPASLSPTPDLAVLANALYTSGLPDSDRIQESAC